MKRTVGLVGGVFLSGAAVLGCGSSSAAPNPTTTAPSPTRSAVKATATTPLAWLVAEAKPANQRLNRDQLDILDASRTSSESDASTYFAHLMTACTAMLTDARRARDLPDAPSVALDRTWQTMATTTAAYALKCLTLTRTRSNAALTDWNKSLKVMDSANAALNSAVSAIRSGEGVSSGE